MVNYQNGKVYKIVNDVDNEVYVGSTTKALSRRMADHRSCINNEQKQNRKVYQHMAKIGVEYFRIELICNFPCNNIEELRAEEGKYIRQFGTLNSKISGRTKKAYDKEYGKQYEKNDKRKEYKQKYNQIYTEKNKENIRQQRKMYYEQNKEIINEQQKEKMECECGSVFRKKEKARHFKTQKHIDFLNAKQ